jgi:AraC-like DNA-binding protein
MDRSLYFSVSEAFDKPMDLPKAWRQLQLIRVTPGVDDLISVGQIKDTAGGVVRLPFSIGIPQMIHNALCRGNDSAACAILEESLEESSSFQATEDYYLLSALIYNMLHDMIVLLKLENPVLLQDVTIPQHERGHEDDLFTKQFPDCFRLIAQKFRSTKEDNYTSFGRKILDYINEQLYNPELYSTMVLDHFNISQPTLQKLMKIITGQTFLVYVETRRLEKARQILSDGAYSIQEVAAQCGFSKTDSFYKAFKRTYGFPPSVMLHKKANST